MKKQNLLLAALLAMSLALPLVGCQQPDVTGTWYGENAGYIEQVNVYEDGSAAELYKAPNGETVETVWVTWEKTDDGASFGEGYEYKLGKDADGNETLTYEEGGFILYRSEELVKQHME